MGATRTPGQRETSCRTRATIDRLDHVDDKGFEQSELTLAALLPADEEPELDGMLAELKAQLREFEAYRERLCADVDDAYATMARHAYFVLFEQEAHTRVPEGAAADALVDIYLGNLAEQFGDSVEVSDEFRWEWTAIPPAQPLGLRNQ